MGLSGIVFLLQFTMIININNIHQNLIFNRKIDDELRLIEMLSKLICENSVNFLESKLWDWMNPTKTEQTVRKKCLKYQNSSLSIWRRIVFLLLIHFKFSEEHTETTFSIFLLLNAMVNLISDGSVRFMTASWLLSVLMELDRSQECSGERAVSGSG